MDISWNCIEFPAVKNHRHEKGKKSVSFNMESWIRPQVKSQISVFVLCIDSIRCYFLSSGWILSGPDHALGECVKFSK